VVGSLLLVTSCTTALHPVPIGVVQSGQPQRYKRVLLVTTDGYERRLTDVVVRSDSLVGTRTDSTDQRLAVALTDIVRLESDEPDIRPAVIAVVGFAAEVWAGMVQALAVLAGCLILKCR
jgi:hypothetical protein